MSIDFSGIKAAMFNTPTDYKQSRKYYSDNLQEKINETYQFSSDTYDIGFEKVFGTMKFDNLVCRVCHAINPKTGLNLGDDFKELKFFDLSQKKIMGERYYFEDSVWITTNTDNYHYVTQSAIIRRCNNTLNFIDSNGKIVREPCIVGYSIKYANIYYNTSIDVPQGTIVVTVQRNDNTLWIDINDRFILNNQVFKVKSVKDYLRSNTENIASVPVIEFEMFVDSISPFDDFENGIANMDKYESIYPPISNIGQEIVLTPLKRKILQSKTELFECYLYINGEKQENEFSFSFYGVDDQFYKKEILNGNSFSVTCLYKSEKSLYVKCKSGDIEKEFSITLGGIY